MKKLTILGILFSTVALSMTAGCGGGGGGGTPPPLPIKAVVTISTSGNPLPAPIGGIEITLNLPSGVTVKAHDDNLQKVVDTGVLTPLITPLDPSDSVLSTGTYSAASPPTPGKVYIYVGTGSGFNTGDVVTVTCDIAPGSLPTAANFSLEGFTPYGLGGITTITGLNAGFTVAFQ